MNCKNCEKENNNGTKFCTRKCRLEWIDRHKIKGAKKKMEKKREQEMMSWGSGFLNVG